jgi:hypothetical protein
MPRRRDSFALLRQNAGMKQIAILTALLLFPPAVSAQQDDASLASLYKRRSKIGLVGEEINVETGVWTSSASHVGGGS